MSKKIGYLSIIDTVKAAIVLRLLIACHHKTVAYFSR